MRRADIAQDLFVVLGFISEEATTERGSRLPGRTDVRTHALWNVFFNMHEHLAQIMRNQLILLFAEVDERSNFAGIAHASRTTEETIGTMNGGYTAISRRLIHEEMWRAILDCDMDAVGEGTASDHDCRIPVTETSPNHAHEMVSRCHGG